MKKLLSMLLAITMLLTLCVPALAEADAEKATGEANGEASHTLDSAEFPLNFNGIDTGMDVKLYFLDGVRDLPYMEVNDWLPLLNLFIGDEGKGITYVSNIRRNWSHDMLS